uniref:RNA helicase n=1 Tax=Phallusia mammillata TaxID=59560 RepID=A0A6F9DBS8_9ASCI|nr:ATP-dependent RNA helicase DHX36 [Phallusia mammillata]
MFKPNRLWNVGRSLLLTMSRRGRYRGSFQKRGYHEDPFSDFKPGSSRGQRHNRGSYNEQRQKSEFDSFEPRSSRGPRHGTRRGRDIGMFYAQKSRARKKDAEKNNIAVVEMNHKQMGAAQHALQQVELASMFDQKQTHSDHIAVAKKDLDAGGKQGFEDKKYSWFHNTNSNTDLDNQLFEEFSKKKTSKLYNKMQTIRQRLPSHKIQKELIDLINSNQIIVISGETGCGKTTQIPQYILDDAIYRGVGSSCKVVCTQPRRISAVSVAERVAKERDERCGEGNSCGYQIRLQNRLPRQNGSILYCTTGILVQWLRSDPNLSQVSHVILDEIHERDLLSDILITIIKEIATTRKDIKIILMSATLNANLFASYFNGCPTVNIPGFTFPVEEYRLEDTMEMIRYQPTDAAYDQFSRLMSNKRDWRERRIGREERQALQEDRENYVNELWEYNDELRKTYSEELSEAICIMDAFLQKNIDTTLIVSLIKHLVQNPLSDDDAAGGAMLVFLPGWEDIKKLNEMITKDTAFFKPHKYRIIPLHSMMPTTNQQEVFERPPNGVTKIVIATNIAETSITIDDIVYVIDCGKSKMNNFNYSKDLNTLGANWLTKANARQRRGRAGRVQAGYCFHLYTKLQEEKLSEFMQPEILRTPLDQTCLQIKILQLGGLHEFLERVMEAPAKESIELSIQKLTALGALDHNENLTPLGYHLAKLPVPPQIGKMLLMGSMFHCLEPILTVAACLSFKQPFVFPLGKEKAADARRKALAGPHNSDHLMLVEAYRGWQEATKRGSAGDYCWRNFMSGSILNMIKDMRRQFTEYLQDTGFFLPGSVKLMNEHSNKPEIVKAVVCSGLYPNVAKMFKKQPRRPPKISSQRERNLSIHPKSVNSEKPSDNFRELWLCYYEKVQSTQINLYDTSEISPFPMLFFGGDINTFCNDEGENMISVDEWIQFRAKPEVASTVLELRDQLDKILAKKIKFPFRSLEEADFAVVRTIVDLLSKKS